MKPVSSLIEFHKFKKDIWTTSLDDKNNWEVEVTKLHITDLFTDTEPTVYYLLTGEQSFPHPSERRGGAKRKIKTRHMNKKKKEKQEKQEKQKNKKTRKQKIYLIRDWFG